MKWKFDPPQPLSWGQESACLPSLSFGGEIRKFVQFYGSNTLPLRQRCFAPSRCFLNFFFFYDYFFRRALVRSCLVREPLRLAGVTKGWWAETPHSPLAMNDGEGLISSSCRLIQVNNHPHLIIKRKPLFLFLHMFNSSSKHCNDLHLLPDLPNAWSKGCLTKRKHLT